MAPEEWISLAYKNLSIKEKKLFVRVHRFITTEKLNPKKVH